MTLSRTQDVPLIKWDPEKRQFCITVRDTRFEEAENQEVRLFHKPDCLYRVRVRKAGADVWTPGFVSPLPAIGVDLLERDTDYIVEMCRIGLLDAKPLPGSVQEYKVRNDRAENISR